MDFNLDDPLGDLLSDNSQDDSFFESVKTKKKTIPKVSNTSKVENIFGITKSAESKQSYQIPEPAAQQKKSIIPSPVMSKQKLTKSDMTLFDDDDIIADLGFDPKKPKNTNKVNILDDLLAPIESTTKKYVPTIRPTTALAIDSASKISRQSTETTETSAFTTTRPRTARHPSITSNDPLGLFGVSSNTSAKLPPENKDPTDNVKIRRKGTTADWLDLDGKADINKNEPKSEAIVAKLESEKYQSVPSDNAIHNIFQINRPQTPLTISHNILAASAIENQNSLHTLQQQEGQVLMATQIKNQESVLVEMQKKQQNLLNQQESQFNYLLQKQLEKQHQLEISIKSQQDRINAYIQLLMTQPAPINFPHVHNTETPKQNNNNANEDNKLDEVEMEHQVKRLELEKLRLEDLISNITVNHEKELEFMENSHKKQISILQANVDLVENRVKEENNYSNKFFSKKLQDLENEKSKLIEEYDKKIEVIKNDKENVINDMRTQHESILDILKKEYQNMITNIRESRLLEFSITQENTSYLQTLRNASDNLGNASGDLETLRNELTTKIDLMTKEKEIKLSVRERQLEDEEKHFKLKQNSFELEKSRLIDLITNLEVQLTQTTKNSSEEKWNQQQRMIALEVDRASFEKEKQYARDQIEHENKKLEEFKEIQLQEYQKMLQNMQEEHQKLLIEKSKFETTKKLEPTYDFSKSKEEIETSIKVAQDAARQADLERERYFKMQRELEMRKRDLIDRENEIRSKRDELENVIISAKAKEKQLQEEIRKVHVSEQNFNTKIQILQNQMRQLAERETQLSHERLMLSKELIEMQDFKKKLEQNKCSLCKIGEKSNMISNILVGNDVQFENNQKCNSFMDFGSNANNPIDKLFDIDVVESLNRMKQMHFDKATENTQLHDQNLNANDFMTQLPTVPSTNFLNSDLNDLEFYQNFKET